MSNDQAQADRPKADRSAVERSSVRISLPERDDLTVEQQKIYDDMLNGPRGVVVGPIRAVIHSPELADRWQKLGEYVRYRTVIPEMLKELAIVVSARRWNSELEWSVHTKIAREAGLSQTVIDAIHAGRAPEFSDPTAAEIYEYARELQMSGHVSDDAYLAIKNRWGEKGVVELTAVIGYYTMVAMTLNAHHVPVPEGTPSTLVPEGETLPRDLSVMAPPAGHK